MTCNLQAARTDKVSTRKNGAGPGGNGVSINEGAAQYQNNGSSSNGTSRDTVLQGTDLLEKPYSNNSNGASYQNNGSSYSKQGSAGQRREAAVADALKDAAAIDEEAEKDPCASGHLTERAVSSSMDREAEATLQSSASVSQQQAAVQEATEAPRVKQSGSRWSKVGKASVIQV